MRQIVFNAARMSCYPEAGYSIGSGWQIYIINADGTGMRQLTYEPDWYPIEPAWSPVPGLQVGSTYTITQAGANLNLRDSPSLQGKVLDRLPAGSKVTILEGPMEADGYYWWKMRTEAGLEGWAVEVFGWYQGQDIGGM
jgi:hypothetical protein